MTSQTVCGVTSVRCAVCNCFIDVVQDACPNVIILLLLSYCNFNAIKDLPCSETTTSDQQQFFVASPRLSVRILI